MQPSFQPYLPAPELRAYVKCYLVLEADFGAGISMNAVPRGLPVLWLSFSPNQTSQWARHDGAVTLGKSTLMGQTTQTVNCTMCGVHQTIYVVFHPTGMHPFLQDGMQPLTDSECALDYLPWITRDHSLTEQLALAPTHADRITRLDTLFIRRLNQLNGRPDRTGEVVQLINARNGNIRIDEVAAYFRVSCRSLERHFLEHVGLTPKQYANIVRFRFVMSYLHANPSASWLDLTHLGNFADQSHLIRHFHSIADESPAAFLAQDHRLDKIFLQMT